MSEQRHDSKSSIDASSSIQRLEKKIQQLTTYLFITAFISIAALAIAIGVFMNPTIPQQTFSSGVTPVMKEEVQPGVITPNSPRDTTKKLPITIVFDKNRDQTFIELLNLKIENGEFSARNDADPMGTICLYVWEYQGSKVQGMYNSTRFRSLKEACMGNVIFVTNRQIARRDEPGEQSVHPSEKSGVFIKDSFHPFFFETHHISKQYHDDAFNNQEYANLREIIAEKLTE
eukprot:TRINITY_DN15427_c0_g1_i1.p1 TRINITY_DN15427_c0_g1~~TRINITY_DN15427_c0_g1_i1.p1  ORF type:complete len:231 (+),score=39.39 TRINITY_DN15427_c0_g1_i1:82-774(+)